MAAPVPASGGAPGRPLLSILAGSAALVVLAAAVTVGADAGWLVTLGDLVARGHAVPSGVPFAAAGSTHWPNVPVLGELTFAGLRRLGVFGLPGCQLAVDAGLLTALFLQARRMRASDAASALVAMVFVIGALPALVVVRAQLLSLLPFVLLLSLLRSEHARPSRRIWFSVAIIGIWTNLHGAVLVGVAMLAGYLVASRLRARPVESSATLLAAVAALMLNPAGLRTTAYYAGVLSNEAARRGVGLWARLSVRSPFDVLLVVSALVLCLAAVRARRPAWEYLVLGGLVVATATAARHGVWLLIFAAGPAARGLTRQPDSRTPTAGRQSSQHSTTVLAGLVATAALAGCVSLLGSRSARLSQLDDDAVLVAGIAGSRVVLAPEPLAEYLPLHGVRVWLSNPIDAFSRQDQSAYLDYLQARQPGQARAYAAASVVVVDDARMLAAARQAGFVLVATGARFTVLVRG